MSEMTAAQEQAADDKLLDMQIDDLLDERRRRKLGLCVGCGLSSVTLSALDLCPYCVDDEVDAVALAIDNPF